MCVYFTLTVNTEKKKSNSVKGTFFFHKSFLKSTHTYVRPMGNLNKKKGATVISKISFSTSEAKENNGSHVNNGEDDR